MSASPSFGASVAGGRPARASAAAPGSPRRSCQASPSPISTSARCASGARSPLAPTDPRDGTTGCTRAVEQLDQQLERLEPDAGEALRQHVGAQRHRRAHDRHRQRLADARGVAAQQVHLQLRQRLGGNLHFGEVAEAGVDAVGRRVAIGELVDDGARGAHARARRSVSDTGAKSCAIATSSSRVSELPSRNVNRVARGSRRDPRLRTGRTLDRVSGPECIVTSWMCDTIARMSKTNIAVLGAQWGDEGKGKIVDMLTPHFSTVARYQGGHNAGPHGLRRRARSSSCT